MSRMGDEFIRDMEARAQQGPDVPEPARLGICVGCQKECWEYNGVGRGAYETAYCLDCDPLAGVDHCEGCGFDAASCRCDRRIP